MRLRGTVASSLFANASTRKWCIINGCTVESTFASTPASFCAATMNGGDSTLGGNAPPSANTTDETLARAKPPSSPLKLYHEFLRAHNLRSCRNSLALYQVHEDLRLVRFWSALRVVQAEIPYLTGVAPNDFDSVFPNVTDVHVDRTQAVVPMTTDASLTPRSMTAMCSDIVHPETKAALRCITVAIVDRDSTTAYYRVFSKFDEIVHPQWKQKKLTSTGVDGDDDCGVVNAADISGDSGSSSDDSD